MDLFVQKKEYHFFPWTWEGADKDSLLDQNFRFLNLLLGPSVYILLKSHFSKNPDKSI